MAKAYFSVIAKESKNSAWSVEFGDYDQEVAKQERDDMLNGGQWHRAKVIRTNGSQASILAAVEALNTK